MIARKETTMSEQSLFACPNCQIGQCTRKSSTYLRVWKGRLVAVPDITVWTCDICGYREYDPDQVAGVDALLGATEMVFEAQRPAPKSPAFEPKDSAPVRRPKP
jgi:YgiT-type zinc finger domain-containing protein